MDGRLDERAWAAADSITDFRQREPAEGQPASERTVVRVVRDADALYIGVRAEDRDVSELRATQLRRDAGLESDDNITLMIDSFHDRRNAFFFGTNPNGAMWDAQQAGVEDWNENWNGIWRVAVSRDSAGWTAEFRIPFQTLRFQGGNDVAFGFNVRRLIRRKNEEVLWTSWQRTQGLQRLMSEGEISGLGALQRPRDVELRPYVLGRLLQPEHDSVGAVTAPGTSDGKAGLDVKLGVASTLTADLTFNTDFAQVEADRQLINLTRFPLFFPEKRQFFLESSDLFAFGTEGTAQLFYSRRVGLSDGQPVPITAGGRLYGKAGGWSLGLLDARTGASDDANDVVIRLRRDLFSRSTVGAMATLRSGPGVSGVERSGGLDLSLPLVVGGQNVVPKLWVAATQTPAAPGTPIAWRASADYPNDVFDNFISVYNIEPGFNPTLGFVKRTGIWGTRGWVEYMPRLRVLGLRQLTFQFPIPGWDIATGDQGSLTRMSDWETAGFEWRFLGLIFRSGDIFEINYLRFLDALPPPDSFEIFTGVMVPPGRYWWNRPELYFQTSAGRPVSVEVQLNWGGFYDGHSTDLEASATWRGGGHLILGADLNTTKATLSTGRFTAAQGVARLEYAFNPRTTLLGFVQYNNEDRRADFNIRFHWIPTIGDDVYVVWNSGYSTDPASPYRFPRTAALTRPLNGALVVKVVHRLAP